MDLPAGLAVVVAIMVVFPLGAVWLARRWRDPPPEKWGIPPERLAAAANTPELVAYRRRIELGLTDGRTSALVEKAIRTGTAAPPELRAATRELAELRIGELDRRARTIRVALWVRLAVAAVLLATAVYVTVRDGAWFLLIYSMFWLPRAYFSSPWYVWRLRRRAEAAVVVANGAG